MRSNICRRSRLGILFCFARIRSYQGRHQDSQGTLLIDCHSRTICIKHSFHQFQVLGDKIAFGELALQCKCKRSASVGRPGLVHGRKGSRTTLESTKVQTDLITSQITKQQTNITTILTGSGCRGRHSSPRCEQETVSAHSPPTNIRMSSCHEDLRPYFANAVTATTAISPRHIDRKCPAR